MPGERFLNDFIIRCFHPVAPLTTRGTERLTLRFLPEQVVVRCVAAANSLSDAVVQQRSNVF